MTTQHGVRIIWGEAVPELVREGVEEHVTRYAVLLPAWCVELRVLWEGSETPNAATMNTFPEYRFAQLVLRPGMATGDAETRRRDIRHELLHVALAPTRHLVFDLLEAFNAEEDHPVIHRTFRELARMANEGAVQDLAEAIGRIEGGGTGGDPAD